MWRSNKTLMDGLKINGQLSDVFFFILSFHFLDLFFFFDPIMYDVIEAIPVTY